MKIEIEAEATPHLASLMLATVTALKDIGGSASLHELDERVVELFSIPEEQQLIEMPNDSRPKLRYFLAWSRTYLRRGGALLNSQRGIWSLTEFGETIESVEQCEIIRKQVHEEERERQRLKRIKPQDSGSAKLMDSQEKGKISQESSTINDNLVETVTSDAEHWRETLLGVLLKMDPTAFERLAQRILRESGFIKVEVRGKTGDGGIDGIGVLRVNLVSFQVYFQCKRWKGSVPSKEIRDFRGALQGRADKGLFITTGTFTSSASDEATRDGAIAIDLIDGERLTDLLKQLSLGVSTTERIVEDVAVDAEFFENI